MADGSAPGAAVPSLWRSDRSLRCEAVRGTRRAPGRPRPRSAPPEAGSRRHGHRRAAPVLTGQRRPALPARGPVTSPPLPALPSPRPPVRARHRHRGASRGCRARARSSSLPLPLGSFFLSGPLCRLAQKHACGCHKASPRGRNKHYAWRRAQFLLLPVEACTRFGFAHPLRSVLQSSLPGLEQYPGLVSGRVKVTNMSLTPGELQGHPAFNHEPEMCERF